MQCTCTQLPREQQAVPEPEEDAVWLQAIPQRDAVQFQDQRLMQCTFTQTPGELQAAPGPEVDAVCLQTKNTGKKQAVPGPEADAVRLHAITQAVAAQSQEQRFMQFACTQCPR
ncbi:hypothetical protein NDU88_006774 [Pleurodeles waltl]|uniref:Uncharacterized protein n=1 Tax=Pleurodeles waltl TaxID=8319 RepID=A0AAV7SQN0_PLEWA|nr:hypothetical protein NDU88_006774 [Pleurodeles waltl]